MARKSPQRPNAKESKATTDAGGAAKAPAEDEPVQAPDSSAAGSSAAGSSAAEAAAEASEAETTATKENEAQENVADEDDNDATAVDRSLWTETRVDPIEIALPSGVGYTLRAYRLSNELAPTDIEGREEDEDPFAARIAGEEEDEDDEEVVILDEEYAALVAGEGSGETKDEDAETDGKARQSESDEQELSTDEEAADEPEEEDEDAVAEEVPFFLTHRGRMLVFKSPESLVSFVRSGAPHDLAQLDSWAELSRRIQPADVAAADADSYELDLVVENLRGGNDTWDLDLLIRAGEIARDVGYALRLPAVLAALSPGSPLDDLDEALRAAAGGGIGGFMGRRRLRRIGAQQASLGWRTIIGKISAAVDWRD